MSCAHFAAERTGTTEARRLPDGRWEYRTAYVCATCGLHFVESHIQLVSARLDEILTEVRVLRSMLIPGPKPAP
jgi:DNA-directed RNA polymerase subunit RPC12/RpoP